MESNQLIGGIPTVILVFGLTEFSKRIGLKGAWLMILSLVLGVVFGTAYHIVSVGLPVTVADWITTIVLGLAIGLTSSGVYDFFNKRLG